MWSCSYCLLASVTLGKRPDVPPPCPVPHLHFGNTSTYVNRGLYGLDHWKEPRHAETPRRATGSVQGRTLSSGTIVLGEAGPWLGLGCSLLSTSLPSSPTVPSWV